LEGIQYTERYNFCRQHSHDIKLGVENLTGGAYDCSTMVHICKRLARTRKQLVSVSFTLPPHRYFS